MCGLIAAALCQKVCRAPVQAMPVVPVTQQTEHRVKEQSLKHESPLSGADDFTLLVKSDSKTKEIVEELLDVQGLLASAVGVPAKAGIAQLSGRRLRSQHKRLGSCTLVSS